MVALMVTTLTVQATVVNLATSFEQPVMTEGGGRTLLVEEITATWCPTCAEIDPELLQVADSHGSRITLLALHPSDGVDAFQPAASQHRIDRLALTNPEVAQSTPTFVVESGEPRRGYDAWADVQRDILNAELARQNVSQLDVEVVKTERGYKASVIHADLISTNQTQLTLMVMEHGKSMPDGVVNPGGDHRDAPGPGRRRARVDVPRLVQARGAEPGLLPQLRHPAATQGPDRAAPRPASRARARRSLPVPRRLSRSRARELFGSLQVAFNYLVEQQTRLLQKLQFSLPAGAQPPEAWSGAPQLEEPPMSAPPSNWD